MNQPQKSPKKFLRLGGLFLILLSLGVILGIGAGYFVIWRGKKFEDLRVLENYKPILFTKVYDRNGTLIDIISSEKRIILDFEDIPQAFVHALVALEDEDFFEHIGVSITGIMAAVKDNLTRDTPRGASTLTQQLVKNITKDSRNSYARKLKEQFLAVQLETQFTKEEIFAMYANEVSFGNNQFGIKAASNYYFGKPVGALTLSESALLAGILQAPSRLNPYRHAEAATTKRNLVLDRMVAEGYIDQETCTNAQKDPLQLVEQRGASTHPLAGHFIDKVRQYLFDKYGEETVRTSSWDIHTTIDLNYQRIAENSVKDGLKTIDKRLGYRSQDCRSIFKRRDPESSEDPQADMAEYFDPTWRRPLQPGVSIRALITKVDKKSMTVRIRDHELTLDKKNLSWINLQDRSLKTFFQPGDVPLFLLVKRVNKDGKKPAEDADSDNPFAALTLKLDQEPDLEGSFLALNPQNGDIMAMVGSYDYGRSKFNRAIQAKRQVGSTFKPFVFGAALEQGFALTDLLFDEPTMFVNPSEFEEDEYGLLRPKRYADRRNNLRFKHYQPRNFYNRYDGFITMREALAKSLNVVAVKLLNSIGYDHVIDYCHRLGLESSTLKPYPSLALGAMEMSLLDVVQSYGTFAHDGIRYEPRFISLIMDAKGRVIEDNPPQGEQVISPQNAYLVASAMKSVVEHPRGTAHRARKLGLKIAGKTGTTNDYTDAWFVGFHRQMVAGAWVGRDLRSTIGRGYTGGSAALPIWIDFTRAIAKDLSDDDFEMPEGIIKVPVDKTSGKLFTSDCDCNPDDSLFEVFLEGTEPTEVCTSNEKNRMGLPWYLQKRSVEYHGDGQGVLTNWEWINRASQRRAQNYLRDLTQPDPGLN